MADIFETNEYNEMVMKFPKYIDLEYVHFFLCFCCYKKKHERFRKIHELIELGSDEISSELDLSRFVRRLRSYGIALYYLTAKKQQELISRMAAFKPLRDADNE